MIIVIIAVILAFLIVLGVVLLLEAKKRVKEGKAVRTNYSGLYKLGKIIVPFSIVVMAVMFVFQIPFGKFPEFAI